jgi:hypothetical protein
VSAEHYWRRAGTTGRAHLVRRMTHPLGHYPSTISECGVVRLAAWVPEGAATRCGLCRRLVALAAKRGAPMVVTA